MARVPSSRRLDPNALHTIEIKVHLITEDQLTLLERGEQHLWKDFFFSSLSVFIVCALNVVAVSGDKDSFAIAMYVNSIVGIIALVVCVYSGWLWHNRAATARQMLANIRERP